MAKLELLTVLLPLEALLEDGKTDKSREVISAIIQEARKD